MQYALPRTIIALLLLVLFCRQTQAQPEEKELRVRYAIHADAGIVGYGGVFTVNFEARIKTYSDKLQLRLRSGFGSAAVGSLGSSSSWMGLPVNVVLLFGKKTHFLEFTAGGIVGVRTDTNVDYTTRALGVWPLVDLGYRLEVSPKGIILRVKIGTGGIGGGIGYAF